MIAEAIMSKLPKATDTARDFEYVSDDDAAKIRVRLQQHFGAAGVHAFGLAYASLAKHHKVVDTFLLLQGIPRTI